MNGFNVVHSGADNFTNDNTLENHHSTYIALKKVRYEIALPSTSSFSPKKQIYKTRNNPSPSQNTILFFSHYFHPLSLLQSNISLPVSQPPPPPDRPLHHLQQKRTRSPLAHICILPTACVLKQRRSPRFFRLTFATKKPCDHLLPGVVDYVSEGK